jgi:hypothetical protein
VSEVWNWNKLAKTEAGKNVCDILLAKVFWSSVEDCLRASASLLIVLRAVDADERPAMLEVAALMNFAKEKIKASFPTQNKQALLKKNLGHHRAPMDLTNGPSIIWGCTLFEPGKILCNTKEGR